MALCNGQVEEIRGGQGLCIETHMHVCSAIMGSSLQGEQDTDKKTEVGFHDGCFYVEAVCCSDQKSSIGYLEDAFKDLEGASMGSLAWMG
jgi:hypothetical protein